MLRRHFAGLQVTVIRAKAPFRISFAGGGTDVPPYPELEGGAVLSGTIDRYAHGSLRPRTDGRISIESVDLGLKVDFPVQEDLDLDGDLRLVKAAIRRFSPSDDKGYSLCLRSQAPPGSGLGSSSTLTVTLVALLQDHYGLGLSNYETAEIAYQIEREDLGIEGGMQDHYAATFGGFNFIEFDDRVIVNPLRIRTEVVNELELSLILCYSGTSRQSRQIIADQSDRLARKEPETLAGLQAQKTLAVQMKSALLRGRLDEFAQLLAQAWEEKRRLSPLITTPRMEQLYSVAKSQGAIGGKVTGAGGGGHILFFCDFDARHRVTNALAEAGATVHEFNFSHDGVVTWRI